MEIISLSVTGFESNCFIVHNGAEAFVIDPSTSEQKILWALEKNGLTLKGILLTHGHFDHIWRAQELREKSGAPLYVHELDAEMLIDAKKHPEKYNNLAVRVSGFSQKFNLLRPELQDHIIARTKHACL